MKKIMSVLLALLLACLPVALAEDTTNNAAIIGLYDIDVMGNNLGELEVWAGIEGTDTPQFMFSIARGESEILASGVGEIDSEQIRFMFDGEDKGYAMALSEVASQLPAQVTEQVSQLPELLKQAIPALDSVVLPAIPAIPIPQLDLGAMLGNGGDTFEFAAEQVDTLLVMGETYIDAFSSKIPQADQLKDVIAQLKGKISVNGSFADDGGAKVTRATILFDGQEAGTLVLTSVENNLRLALEAGGAEQGGLTIASAPDTASVDIDVDVGGNDVGGLSLYQEDGLQKIVFEINAGEKVGIEFDYGTQNGRDILSLTMDAGSQGGLDFTMDTAIGEDGTRAGTVSFNGDFDSNQVSFSAGVSMYLAKSLELGGITWPETLLPFSEMQASEALQPVVEYIQSIAQDSAA